MKNLKIDENIIKGTEFSAIFEKQKDLQMDQLLQDVKDNVDKLQELQPHKRAKLEIDLIAKYKNEGNRNQNPRRYLVAANWFTKWMKTLEAMKNGENVDESSLKKRFMKDQQALVDDYVKGNNIVMHLSIQEKLEIYELVNMKTWYLLFFMYGEISTVKYAPLVILSDQLEYHLKEKEHRLETLSQSTRMTQTNTSNRRGGEPQQVVINENHYHIEQMNVNNQYQSNDQNESSTQKSESSKYTNQKKERRVNTKELKDGIVGLKNNSLYCYMNACLQCILPITGLREYYLNTEFKRFHNTTTLSNSNEYSRKMSEFLGDVFNCSGSNEQVLNPTGLKNLIRKKFYPTMQHDSHEFFMHIIGSLQDEETPTNLTKFDGNVTKQNQNRTMEQICNQYFEANPSIIDQTFSGINRSVVECGSCAYESITFKPFSAMSLGFESTLQKSLQRHFETSQFDRDNKYKCEKCGKKTQATHYQQICYLPDMMVFHIKRFALIGKKISKHLEYPKQIQMSPYQQKQDNFNNQQTKFNLIGLTEHVGSNDSSGHYTAHSLREGNWYKFDDEYFKKVSDKEALSREAYLLFYQRV